MSTKKKSKSESSGTSTTTTPGTQPAVDALPGLTQTFNNAINQGAYTGDFVATPTVLDRYRANYTPRTDLLADTYVPTQLYANGFVPDQAVAQQTTQGLTGGADFINNTNPVLQDTVGNQLDFWNRVSTGEFLQPNAYLDNYTNSIRDQANEEKARANLAFDQSASAAGGYTNSNWARARAWSEDRHATQLDRTMSELYYRNFLTEMDRMERAAPGAATAFGIGLSPFGQLDSIEQGLRNAEQQGIDNTNIIGAAQERADQIGLNNTNQIGAIQQQANQNQINETNALLSEQERAAQNEIDNQQMVNAAQYGADQAGIDNAIAQHSAQQQELLQLYAQYFGLLNMIPGQTTDQQSQTTNTQTTSGLGPALSAVGAVGSLFTGGGPLAGIMGALGGAKGGADQGGGVMGNPTGGMIAAGNAVGVNPFTGATMPTSQFNPMLNYQYTNISPMQFPSWNTPATPYNWFNPGG